MNGFRQAALLVTAAFAGGLVVWVGIESREVRETEPEAAEKAVPPSGLVRLDAAAVERAGIRAERPRSYSLQPQLEAYGYLEEDPSRSFTVRAPLAGTLQAPPGGLWPALGQTFSDGAAIGLIEPRLTNSDRIALTGQLNTARADLRASEATATAARAAFERARTLNNDRKNVSDRVLQQAESQWTGAQARLEAARDSVRLLEDSLKSTGPAGRASMVAARGGEVVEVLAQPGEAVESGQPIVRLARFDRLLARVAVPVGERVPVRPTRALISAVGFEDQPAWGERVSFGASAAPGVEGATLVYRFTPPSPALRPGLAAAARIDLAGEARHGLVVPLSAVVHFNGKQYFYVEIAAGTFSRRELESISPVEGGYFTVSLRADARIVVSGAQVLLSEENKTRIGVEEEGE